MLGEKRRGLQGERLKLRTQGYRNRAMAVWMCSVLDWPCLLWPGLGVVSHLVWAKERTRKTAAVPVDPELLILLICITLSFSIHTQSSPLSFSKYTQELSQEYLATGLLQHLPPPPPPKKAEVEVQLLGCQLSRPEWHHSLLLICNSTSGSQVLFLPLVWGSLEEQSIK